MRASSQRKWQGRIGCPFHRLYRISDAGAQSLIDSGAQAYRGDLEDLESLRSGAALSDRVIQCALNQDFSKFAANCEPDRQAIDVLGSVLAGSDRPLVVTSRTAFAAPGRLATEEDMPVANPSYPRLSEQTAGALYHAVAEQGLSLREIAESIGRGLKVPVVSKSPEQVAQHFGFLGFFAVLDCPASSALTQEWLRHVVKPHQINILALSVLRDFK